MPTPARRLLTFALAAIAGAAVAVGAVALAPSSGTDRAGSGSVADVIDARMRELQIIPMGGQRPHPFTLSRLDGTRLALADLKGQAALLYFWATW